MIEMYVSIQGGMCLVLICHLSGTHLSWCPFVRDPFVQVLNCPGPICSGAHLSRTRLSGTHFSGTQMSWCPTVRDPLVLESFQLRIQFCLRTASVSRFQFRLSFIKVSYFILNRNYSNPLLLGVFVSLR